MNHAPNLYRAVWDYYGLTQAGLAGYLGVTRPQLAIAETAAGRELPGAAMLRLIPFLPPLPPPWGSALPEPAAPTPELPPPPTSPELLPRYHECLLDAQRRTRALAPLLRRAAQARRLLALPAASPDAHASRWLAHFEAEARAHHTPAATAARLLLVARLAASRYEATLLAGPAPEELAAV